ncbi:MAG TPA: hypothetical protein HA224_04040 [Nanoarchaeota archaeon]|nr:hypothetical protein [Nanoarchaeota archaeon]
MIYDTARINERTAIVYVVESEGKMEYCITQFVPIGKSLSSIVFSKITNMQFFTQRVQSLREQGFIIASDLSDEVLKEEAGRSIIISASVLSRGRIEVQEFNKRSKVCRILNKDERDMIMPVV